MSELELADLGLGHVRVANARLDVSPAPVGTTYGDPAGSMALRVAVANWQRTEPARVAITTGASVGLAAILCMLPRPASILVPRPYYSAYGQIPALIGHQLLTYDLDASDGWQLSAQSLVDSIRPDTRAVIINQPHNPTGGVTGALVLKRIAPLLEAAEVLIISDETYAGIVFDGVCIPDVSLIFGTQRLVRVLSFSKLFGMPGERLGCLIADPELVGPIVDAHWSLAMSPPASAQAMALAALRSSPARHIEVLVADLACNRATAIEMLDSRREFEFVAPSGGCFLWLKVADCPLDARNFARLCRETGGVRVVPGPVFGVEHPVYVRVSYAVPPDELVLGLRRLVDVASTLASRRTSERPMLAGQRSIERAVT